MVCTKEDVEHTAPCLRWKRCRGACVALSELARSGASGETSEEVISQPRADKSGAGRARRRKCHPGRGNSIHIRWDGGR